MYAEGREGRGRNRDVQRGYYRRGAEVVVPLVFCPIFLLFVISYPPAVLPRLGPLFLAVM